MERSEPVQSAATAGPGCIGGGVGVKDACQLARGVPLCPDECEVRAARPVTAPQRDRHTTPHCLTLIPAGRVPARGVVGPNRIKVVLADGHHGDGHKRPDGQCVLCAVPEALLHANPDPCGWPPLASGHLPFLPWPRRSRRVAPARSQISDSLALERSGMLAGCMSVFSAAETSRP